MELFRWRSIKIGKKIMIGTLLSLVPMILIVIASSSFLKSSSLKNSETITRLVVKNYSANINSALNDLANIFQEWTKEDVYGMAIEYQALAELKNELAGKAKTAKGFCTLLLTDKAGKILLSGNESAELEGRVFQKAKDLAQHEGHFVTLAKNPFMNRDNPESYLFSFTTKNSEGQVNGLLLAFVDCDLLQQNIETMNEELATSGFPDTREFVVDLNNKMLLAHTDKSKLGAPLEGKEITEWLEARQDLKMAKVEDDFVVYADLLDPKALMEGTEEALENTTMHIAALTPEGNILGKVRQVLLVSFLIAGIGIALVVLVTMFISRAITRPVSQTVEMLQELSQGNLQRRLKMASGDEIGQMADALDNMAMTLTEMIKEIDNGVNTLSSSSSEMASIADQMTLNSDNTVEKSNTVAAAAEEMNSNMNSVAASMEQAATNVGAVATRTEEMNSSIAEIAQNASRAKESVAGAVDQSQKASRQVNELGNLAEEIGAVTETIKAISDKTNLLALNATIEAARAGEAGKGFAVVANEIKDLAQQTAEATGDITDKLQAIQGATGSTVAEIEEVAGMINQVDEIVGSIAAAVEQQNSATTEISGNVGQVADGIKNINENVTQSSEVTSQVAQDISAVNEAASEMRTSSGQVQQSVSDLKNLAGQLKDLVGKFSI